MPWLRQPNPCWSPDWLSFLGAFPGGVPFRAAPCRALASSGTAAISVTNRATIGSMRGEWDACDVAGCCGQEVVDAGSLNQRLSDLLRASGALVRRDTATPPIRGGPGADGSPAAY
jgi:hypothetical protein